jgi:hypothetical protein
VGTEFVEARKTKDRLTTDDAEKSGKRKSSAKTTKGTKSKEDGKAKRDAQWRPFVFYDYAISMNLIQFVLWEVDFLKSIIYPAL